jgi:small subunit ribosomal protein S11
MADKTKAVDMAKTQTTEVRSRKTDVVLRGKKKQIKPVEKGRIYIHATFNNTICTLTDDKGNVLSWGSSGASGFKGARKSTPYAATSAVDNLIRKAMAERGLKEVEIYIKGPGSGRDAALRALKPMGLRISKIADITPIAHNGPRPKKKRRI